MEDALSMLLRSNLLKRVHQVRTITVKDEETLLDALERHSPKVAPADNQKGSFSTIRRNVNSLVADGFPTNKTSVLLHGHPFRKQPPEIEWPCSERVKSGLDLETEANILVVKICDKFSRRVIKKGIKSSYLTRTHIIVGYSSLRFIKW